MTADTTRPTAAKPLFKATSGRARGRPTTGGADLMGHQGFALKPRPLPAAKAAAVPGINESTLRAVDLFPPHPRWQEAL